MWTNLRMLKFFEMEKVLVQLTKFLIALVFQIDY